MRRIVAVLVLVVLASACTPEQVQGWFAARGMSIDRPTAEWVANNGADRAARSSGAPGTCSETGIFYAESGGNWHAQNPTSSASGGYQFVNGTWAGHRGYHRAKDAPPWVQRERFHQVWRGGAGASHWAASVC